MYQIPLFPFLSTVTQDPSLFIVSLSGPSHVRIPWGRPNLVPLLSIRVGGSEAAHGTGDALAHGHGGGQSGGNGERGSALKETPID